LPAIAGVGELLGAGAVAGSAGTQAINTACGGDMCADDISDDAFVRFDPIRFDSAINRDGLLTEYSDGRIWLTKYGYIKDIINPKDLESVLYRQDLWLEKLGSFSDGATLRVVNVSSATAAGVTNTITGVPQWFVSNDIPNTLLQNVRRLMPK
jgi:hypothetical protein